MMKKIYLFLIGALMFSAPSMAQYQNQTDGRVHNSVGGAINLGYSAMFSGSVANYSPSWGAGAGVSFLYELQYKHFLMHTGVGTDLTWSSSIYKAPELTRPAVEYPTMQVHYDFSRYTDQHSYSYLNVPLMFGGIFNDFFFLVGGKVGILPYLTSLSTKSDVRLFATDEEFIDPMYDIYTHGLQSYSLSANKQSFNLNNINVMASAEIGINLDKWLVPQPKKGQRRSWRYKPPVKECMHYRLSFFADYGLMNLLNYQSNATSPQGELVQFNSLTDLIPYSPLGYTPNKNNALNNLFVGVKFVFTYEPPKKQHKPKANPPLVLFFRDADTQKPLQNTYIEIHNDKTNRVQAKKQVDSPKGKYSRSLLAGDYTLTIRKNGYIAIDSMHVTHADDYDTLYIDLKPQPKPEPIPQTEQTNLVKKTDQDSTVSFVLKNMHFATNQTQVLVSSKPAVVELYKFLKANPKIRVCIVGHTDDVGSDAANLKLSRGRAAAVKKLMVDHGIDASRMETLGKGESEPLVPNTSDANRQINRRVEIIILNPEDMQQ